MNHRTTSNAAKPNGHPGTLQDTAYDVVSNIPLPGESSRRFMKYPFARMEIGDSFALEANDINSVERVRAACSYYGIRHPPMRFSIRRVDPINKAYRCWRVA